MSYTRKHVPGQRLANRARHHVRRLMTEQGVCMSKRQVPGVSPKTLYNFISAKRDITLTKLENLARFLRVEPAELFEPIGKKK